MTNEKLTKREYFAAMAMQGILSNPALEQAAFRAIAMEVVEMADALIAELEKGKE